jgi:hypothetical protein
MSGADAPRGPRASRATKEGLAGKTDHREDGPAQTSRREVLQGTLGTLLTYSLLRILSTARLLAEPVSSELDRWLRSVHDLCGDLQRQSLSPRQWQEGIGRLLERVSLEDLLAYIDFPTLERRLVYPDLGVDTASVRFPGVEGLPAGLSFHPKVFGMERDRAILPHGHRNMVSAHLVLGGRFHLRQYERRGEDGGGLVVEPSVDRLTGPGEASSISDQHNNIHWLIARGGPAYTLDVIVTGLEGPGYGIDNLDPDNAEALPGGLLRMPRLTVEEALRRYGKDHHELAS